MASQFDSDPFIRAFILDPLLSFIPAGTIKTICAI